LIEEILARFPHAVAAIRQAEFKAMREAYRKQPDSAAGADDWSIAEAYKP
jgi:hypothetical protein